ncbi:RHS repeat-associated core domain-containing protein [Mariniflexile ostreae]|uniref:RHS repeat-associated core domain-containing protein n=1 Tax=Mariniflexile ostreae TaxID=1520892 RepID=A0ABV5FC64_9FLAO
MEYIAFGEILFEEHSSSFSSPYLFNGKELDRETNLSYYGARYLDMKTSLWLSVGPLAEKYPGVSPYVYTFNNPINFIDPDGRDGIRVIDVKNKTITIRANYYVQTESRYSKNRSKGSSGYSSKEIASMQKDYNKYLNGLGASVNEGEYSGYKINFDLQFKEGGSVGASEQSAQNDMVDGNSIGNSFSKWDTTLKRFETKEIDNGDGTTSTSTVGGVIPI